MRQLKLNGFMKKMLTNPNNHDKILTDDRGTDFLLSKWAFSRCRNLTVPLSSAEQSPFYLEEINDKMLRSQLSKFPMVMFPQGVCNEN